MPAAGAAPQASGVPGAAAILGGVLQLEPNDARPLPGSASAGQPAASDSEPATPPAQALRADGDGRATTQSDAAATDRPRGVNAKANQPQASPPGSPDGASGKAPTPTTSRPDTTTGSKAAASSPTAEPGVLVPEGDGRGAVAPAPAGSANGRELVLDRRRRQLVVIENGTPLRRFPVAVGMPGWETPVGRFTVIEKQTNPVWEHPVSGLRIQPGPDNPLGSRWIGFYRDCRGRRGFNGKEHLVVEGCVVAGFHGTPNRASVGRAASHGCVRLYDEHVRDLFDLVRVGTPVTVLP